MPVYDPNNRLLCEIETVLSDGRPICLRTIRPSDEQRIRDGIMQLSDRSRYLRFFSAFREPPESIVKQLSAVDGHDHIGWGAILLDGDNNPPIGAAHAVRSDEDSSKGELAIALLDDFHGLGLARILIAALLADCAREDMRTLEIQVLGENQAASNLFDFLGAVRKPALDTVAHYELDVEKSLAAMRATSRLRGVIDVLGSM